MQAKTAQTKTLKLPDTLKYCAISGMFMSTAFALYLLTASS